MPRSRPHRITLAFLRSIVYVTAGILVLVGLAIVAVQTGWVKNRIRQLIVSQANNYLTGTLEIGRLEGSLLRGVQLGDIRLTRDGQTIITVDRIDLSYSIRELFEPGLIIRRIRLTRAHVVAARLPDGRWNLGALLKREGREQERTGPGRPLHILAIEVIDSDVAFHDPLTFGSVHVPSRYGALNASLSFDYQPVTWHVNLSNVSWVGDASNLTMRKLSGGMTDGPDGWQFDNLAVQTPRSGFTLAGRINRGNQPTALNLHVAATRFAFQEWSGIVGGLRNIAIDSTFDVTLQGPLAALATGLSLQSTNGGGVDGQFVLDTTVDGWHGAGDASVSRLDLAQWLNRPDRPSDITGHVNFNLDLDLGHHFPRGAFSFDGPHARYLEYEMEDVRARGTLTRTDAMLADVTGTAYGSAVHITSGSIGIDAPFAYRFAGAATHMDLRELPPQVPVTHVESLIALDSFDVTGQFEPPSIAGRAQLGDSVYLGAAIAAGTVGAIDTSAVPVKYSGEGDVSRLDIHRFGEGLSTAWMLEPRWAGIVSGHFHVEGVNGDSHTMRVDGGGHLTRADMFGGRLFDAEMTLHVADGTLKGTYNGQLADVDAARAFSDARFDATLTGTVRANFEVGDLLVRAAFLPDYTVDGTLDARNSTIRGIAVDTASLAGSLRESTLTVTNAHVSGPAIDARGSGAVELDGERSSNFDYDVARGDVSLADEITGRHLSGTMVTSGRLTGPTTEVRLAGDATVNDLIVFADHDASGGVDAKAVTTTLHYDVTVPTDNPSRTKAHVTTNASLVEMLGRQIPEASGTITYDGPRLDADVRLGAESCSPADLPVSTTGCLAPGVPNARIAGSMVIHSAARELDLAALTVTVGRTAWRLTNTSPAPPIIAWSEKGLDTQPLVFTQATEATGQPDATGNTGDTGRVTISGTWRTDGTGALRVAADRVSLDRLLGESDRPAPYGGTVDMDATIAGTRDRPTATAQVAITDGRVRKLPYQRLGGTIAYANGQARVDVRLDQAPGTWLTAAGTVPITVADTSKPAPIELSVASSSLPLGLLEGITDVVHNVAGQATLNVTVTGTNQEPHFAGSVAFANVAFLVAASGVSYKNGRAALDLASDRMNVTGFHLEDRNGHALDLTGTLGTRALTVGDLQIDAVARHFEVLHNPTGTVDVDAHLNLRGQIDAPIIAGDITILSGELKVDEIFARALFQPYSTEAAAAPTGAAGTVDAIAALNPWDRLSLDIALHSPGTLRLTGDNVQVAQNTPLGLGSFNLHATGDLYLSKARGEQMYISGSFDSITGSYAFQGRRFTIDPTSSINFHGDLDPGLFVTVNRIISGVDARVTIAGTLHAPELRLASTPPLDSSDILSLIVFNASTNELTGPQQQELAVRAGTLAYGFVATPLVSALQRSLGLDTLEIAPPDAPNAGARVTVGSELVPGLVAQFTRQFGEQAYDEATVEYYISRLFRIRATFSDAGSQIQQAWFRRVERAGIDLLLFFSF